MQIDTDIGHTVNRFYRIEYRNPQSPKWYLWDVVTTIKEVRKELKNRKLIDIRDGNQVQYRFLKCEEVKE